MIQRSGMLRMCFSIGSSLNIGFQAAKSDLSINQKFRFQRQNHALPKGGRSRHHAAMRLSRRLEAMMSAFPRAIAMATVR